MSAAQKPPSKQAKNPAIHLISGGVAGCMEALTCHPLDTIKVRLQLKGERLAKGGASRTVVNSVAGHISQDVAAAAGAAAKVAPARQTFIGVGVQIVQKEGFLSLYKGLGAVVTGIVPKMAIRFSSFEQYKELLADKKTGKPSSAGVFVAGLGAGITEAVLVVTPMDVIKIRLQAQRHSMTDPLDIPKYRNAAHCAYVMIKEEGVASLYKGVALTALRQATNQAANFTVYEYLKSQLRTRQPDLAVLPAYQTMLVGFVSGACGPLFNAPIDTIKTRIQKNPSKEKGWQRFVNVASGILKNEGWRAFYKGLTPRVLRVAPGQSVTFVVYEYVYKSLMDFSSSLRVEELDKAGMNVKKDLNEA